MRALIIVKRVLALATVFCGLCGPAAAAGDACAGLAASVDALPPRPVFLASYPTAGPGPLQDTAFVYDNAVAAIALIACGQTQKARRIGDAFLFALDHDRHWRDGRLRNAYVAGALESPVKLPGWWDRIQNRWLEDGYQLASDNGNMAWAMLALLALDRATQDPCYRAGAARIGDWTLAWRRHRGPGGFAGGTFGEEPDPAPMTWKSTEHNADLAAAFAALARATGDRRWLEPAQAASRFVRAMWRPSCHCYAVGTGLDGATRNDLLALDAQIWPSLALPENPPRAETVLATARARLAQSGGYAYSEALHGLWTEGTAQVALLTALSGDAKSADALGRVIAAMRAPGGGYYASDTSALPTGFMLQTDPNRAREYFHIRALAPLAWVALAERRVNPFR